jgi:hypothetical protein
MSRIQVCDHSITLRLHEVAVEVVIKPDICGLLSTLCIQYCTS